MIARPLARAWWIARARHTICRYELLVRPEEIRRPSDGPFGEKLTRDNFFRKGELSLLRVALIQRDDADDDSDAGASEARLVPLVNRYIYQTSVVHALLYQAEMDHYKVAKMRLDMIARETDAMGRPELAARMIMLATVLDLSVTAGI